MKADGDLARSMVYTADMDTIPVMSLKIGKTVPFCLNVATPEVLVQGILTHGDSKEREIMLTTQPAT